MAGRRRKADALKRAEGNPGKRALHTNEISADPTVPYCPRGLSIRAKQKWKIIVRMLKERRVIRREDGEVLALLCDCLAKIEGLDASIEALAKDQPAGGKYLVKSGNSATLDPRIFYRNRLIEMAKSMAVEFGMTAAARSRLHIPADEVPPGQPEDLEKLLMGAGEVEHDADDVTIQ
jgi:P27 family predicted phage terminase small subunit